MGKAQTVQASALLGWGGLGQAGGPARAWGMPVGVSHPCRHCHGANEVCVWGCHCMSCDVTGAWFLPTWSMNQTKNLQTSGAAAARGKQRVPGGN